MKYFAEGGPAQQVTQFQPTYSPAQQGEPQVYDEPPPMEESPQDYNQSPQYAPTQQYSAPASNPMTAGLGSYLEGLKYKAPTPVAPVVTPVAPVTDTTSQTMYNPTTHRYETNPSYVTSDDSSEEVPYVGRPRFDDGGDKAGGPIHAYASGGSTPQGIASLGRGQDSMLVHMTPGEVHGLQQLAMRHGGSLTINPQTGLPEAGFLSSLLPMIAGIGLNMAFPGSGALIGAGIGGLTALATGSLSKGLTYGLGAYSGAGLGESLSSMGAEQANKLALPEIDAASQAATTSINTTGNAAADFALKLAETNTSDAIDAAIEKGRLTDDPYGYIGDKAYRADLSKNPLDNRLLYNTEKPQDFAANRYSKEGVGFLQSQGSTGADIAANAKEAAIETAQTARRPLAYLQPTQDALARGPAANAFEGFKQLGTKEGLKTLGGKLGYSGVAGLAAPFIASALTPAPFTPPPKKPEQYYHTSYNPPKYNPATGAYEPASYGPGSYYTNPTQYAAEGGTVGYTEGGPAFYPLTGDARGPGEKPQYSSDIYGDDSGAGINNNKAGRGSYSDAAGKGIHENTPSGVEELFSKVSPATLARFKTAKNAAKQAAAIKELRKRANTVNDYSDEETVTAAQGGLMGLNTYAAGGKLLRGPGDGMSDSIPAVINGVKPQRAALADGEFVMPADVVSHLGNGSTEAGSKRLYAMMDRVRKARTGNPKQGKQINADRFMPA